MISQTGTFDITLYHKNILQHLLQRFTSNYLTYPYPLALLYFCINSISEQRLFTVTYTTTSQITTHDLITLLFNVHFSNDTCIFPIEEFSLLTIHTPIGFSYWHFTLIWCANYIIINQYFFTISTSYTSVFNYLALFFTWRLHHLRISTFWQNTERSTCSASMPHLHHKPAYLHSGNTRFFRLLKLPRKYKQNGEIFNVAVATGDNCWQVVNGLDWLSCCRELSVAGILMFRRRHWRS